MISSVEMFSPKEMQLRGTDEEFFFSQSGNDSV